MIQFNHTKQKWHICVRVLSLRSSVSWFCDSPDTPVMSCFHVSTLEPCALSSACLLSCWSVVFGSRHSCLEFLFRVGVRTLALHVLSHCVSVRSRVRSPARSSVHVCFGVLHAVRIFIGLCIHWLRAFVLSCFV